MKHNATQTNAQPCTEVEEVERLRRRVAELEAIQAEYTASQEQYQVLVENLSEVLYAVDENGRLTYISPAVEPLSGYTPAELLGRSFLEFLRPDDVAAIRESFSQLIQEPLEPLEPIESRVLTKAAEVRWVRSSRQPIIQAGQIRGVRGVITDITKQKQTEHALQDSLERFDLVMQATGEGVWEGKFVVTADGFALAEVYYSPRFKTLLGYADDEFANTRQDWEILLHLDDYARVMRALGKHLVYRVPFQGDYRLRTKAGVYRWFGARGQAVWNAAGQPVRMAGSIRDITDHKQAQAALRESEERYRHLVDNSLGLICTHDLEGTVLSVNPAATQALGYQLGEGVGSSLRTFLAPAMRPLFDAYLASMRQRGRDSGYMRVLTKTGEERVWEYRNVCCEGAGRPPYVLGHAQDVTERMQTEETLRHAHAELEQRVQDRTADFMQANTALLQAKDAAETANRLKSEFLATMSHELRTPLHIILGYLDLVTEGATGSLPEQAVSKLGRVREKAFELFELITAVLDVSRLEVDRTPVNLQTIQIAEVLAALQEEMQDLQVAFPLTFVWQSAAQLPLLTTDLHKLKMILKNLIGNAIKFTEQGSLTVAAQSCSGGVEISVTDTGIGIPAEALATIFEPFRQVDGSDTRRYGGVGLGLHIVQRLVELLQGTITVESELGRGSTFRVWLPVEPPLAASAKRNTAL